jgi:glycosyltransferase involved in cell wall biosynthesis
MHVVVIDPGFEDLHSHHANVNEGLFLYFNTNEQSSLITLASRQILSTTNVTLIPQYVEPHFTTPCYTNRLNPLNSEQEQLLAEKFADELALASAKNIIQASSFLVFHTFYSFHLLGLAIWLQRSGERFGGGILLCGMFYPGAKQLSDKDNIIEYRRYLRFKLAVAYLKDVFDKNRLVVATSCLDYVYAYELLFDCEVTIHPIITHRGNCQRNLRRPDMPKSVLLYAGSVKQDKGLRFILDVTENLLSDFPDVKFIFHLNSLSPGIRDFPDAQALLDKLLQTYQNLECVFGYLDNEAFQKLLDKADAVICHYDPIVYHHKTSGLLWDAMSRENTGVICTNDSWLAREYRAVGGEPFTFNYNKYDSLRYAILNWCNWSGPFIQPNHYFKSLVMSFPKWVKQQGVNLHNVTKTV